MMRACLRKLIFCVLMLSGIAPAYAQKEALKIPPILGSTTYFSPGKEGGTLYLIKDTHDSVLSQKRIFGLLHFLQKKQGVDRVLLEGLAGEPGTDFFRSCPLPDKMRAAVYFFLEHGEISGAAAASLAGDTRMKYSGLEDKDAYFHAYELYLKALAARDKRLSDFSPRNSGEQEGLIRKAANLTLERSEWETLISMPEAERKPQSLAPEAFAYYEATIERESAFIRNTASIFRTEHAAVALVVGGFHVPELVRIFCGMDFTVAVIEPAVPETGGSADSAFGRPAAPSWFTGNFGGEEEYNLQADFADSVRAKILRGLPPEKSAAIDASWQVPFESETPGTRARELSAASVYEAWSENTKRFLDKIFREEVSDDELFEMIKGMYGAGSIVSPFMMPVSAYPVPRSLLGAAGAREPIDTRPNFLIPKRRATAGEYYSPFPEQGIDSANSLLAGPHTEVKRVHIAPGMFAVFSSSKYESLLTAGTLCGRDCAAVAVKQRVGNPAFIGLGNFRLNETSQNKAAEILRGRPYTAGSPDAILNEGFDRIVSVAKEFGPLFRSFHLESMPGSFLNIRADSSDPYVIQTGARVSAAPKTLALFENDQRKVETVRSNTPSFGVPAAAGEEFEDWRTMHRTLEGVDHGWLAAFDVDHASRLQDIPAGLRLINDLMIDELKGEGVRFFESSKTEIFAEKEEGFIYVPSALTRAEIKEKLEALRLKIERNAPTTITLAALNLEEEAAQAPQPFWMLENRLVRMVNNGKISGRNKLVMTEEGLASPYNFNDLEFLKKLKTQSGIPEIFRIVEVEQLDDGNYEVKLYGDVKAAFLLKPSRVRGRTNPVIEMRPIAEKSAKKESKDVVAVSVELWRVLLAYLKERHYTYGELQYPSGWAGGDAILEKLKKYVGAAEHDVRVESDARENGTRVTFSLPALNLEPVVFKPSSYRQPAFLDEAQEALLSQLLLMSAPRMEDAAVFRIQYPEMNALFKEFQTDRVKLLKRLNERLEKTFSEAGQAASSELAPAIPFNVERRNVGLMMGPGGRENGFEAGYIQALSGSRINTLFLGGNNAFPAIKDLVKGTPILTRPLSSYNSAQNEAGPGSLPLFVVDAVKTRPDRQAAPDFIMIELAGLDRIDDSAALYAAGEFAAEAQICLSYLNEKYDLLSNPGLYRGRLNECVRWAGADEVLSLNDAGQEKSVVINVPAYVKYWQEKRLEKAVSLLAFRSASKSKD